MSVILTILLVATTQLIQVMLIVNNQDTNPLLFVIPLDMIMLAGLFVIIERPPNDKL